MLVGHNVRSHAEPLSWSLGLSVCFLGNHLVAVSPQPSAQGLRSGADASALCESPKGLRAPVQVWTFAAWCSGMVLTLPNEELFPPDDPHMGRGRPATVPLEWPSSLLISPDTITQGNTANFKMAALVMDEINGS